MKQHRADLLALLFGLAFAATGTAFLVHELTNRDIEPAWIAGAGFIALGLIALTVTLLRRFRDTTPAPVSGEDATDE